MPQKKNPDSLELLRGKSGRIFGDVRHVVLQCYSFSQATLDGRIHDDAEGFTVNI
jgi:hypothetical protein